MSKYAKDLKKHKSVVHEKILVHDCKYCGKKFSSRGNLNQHEVIHTDVTPFQCHVCAQQCKRKSELMKHLDTHENVDVKVISKWEHLESPSPHKDIWVDVQGVEGAVTTGRQVQIAGADLVGIPGSVPQPFPLLLAQCLQGGDLMSQADLLMLLTCGC